MEKERLSKCPCHPRCPYRTATCHGTCWIYGLWKEEKAEFNRRKELEKERYNYSHTLLKTIREKQRKNYRRNSMKWT